MHAVNLKINVEQVQERIQKVLIVENYNKIDRLPIKLQVLICNKLQT